MELALNNLQRLICYKTQQTKPTYKIRYKIKLYTDNIQLLVRPLSKGKILMDLNKEIEKLFGN